MGIKTKSKKFQMRLSPLELAALYKLAQRDGVTASSWLTNHIRAQAQKKGIPV